MSARMLSTIRAHARLLAAFAVSVAFAVAALPALAQQQGQATPNAPSPQWGGWHHHHHHAFAIIGPIFVVLAIIGLMAIFVWLVRWATRGYPFYGGFGRGGGPGRGRAALDILDERFARGEIDKAEFEEKRKLLGR